MTDITIPIKTPKSGVTWPNAFSSTKIELKAVKQTAYSAIQIKLIVIPKETLPFSSIGRPAVLALRE